MVIPGICSAKSRTPLASRVGSAVTVLNRFCRDSPDQTNFPGYSSFWIPSNIIPHSKGIKCGLIRSNSPFSYSNHRPAKPKIPKPLVYAQVSPLGTSFATP